MRDPPFGWRRPEAASGKGPWKPWRRSSTRKGGGMGRKVAPGWRAFHEAPLVGFTTLATMGCGVGAAHLLAFLVGGSILPFPHPTATFLTALLALALLFSLGHLGKPLRSPLALRGIGRSPLSHEVAAVGAALGGGLAATLLPPSSPLAVVAAVWTALSSVIVLLSIGSVYRLPHQYTWRGPALLQPLVQGALWGWVALPAGWGFLADPPAGAPLTAATWILLGVDASLLLFRMAEARTAPRAAEAAHPVLFRRGRWILGARFVLGNAIPVGALLVGSVGGAMVSLTLAVVMDRFAFYGLASRWTTEAEVISVEALL